MASLEDIIDGLRKLMRLDYDSARCYDQALDEIDEPSIHATILRFRDDHERHVDDLAAALLSLGAAPAERSRDFKGVVMEGFTAIRAMMGIEGSLKALRTNEKMLLKRYEDAVAWGCPVDIQLLLDRNYADERAHMDYIQRAIAGKIWEPTISRMG